MLIVVMIADGMTAGIALANARPGRRSATTSGDRDDPEWVLRLHRDLRDRIGDTRSIIGDLIGRATVVTETAWQGSRWHHWLAWGGSPPAPTFLIIAGREARLAAVWIDDRGAVLRVGLFVVSTPAAATR